MVTLSVYTQLEQAFSVHYALNWIQGGRRQDKAAGRYLVEPHARWLASKCKTMIVALPPLTSRGIPISSFRLNGMMFVARAY